MQVSLPIHSTDSAGLVNDYLRCLVLELSILGLNFTYGVIILLSPSAEDVRFRFFTVSGSAYRHIAGVAGRSHFR